MFGTQTGESKSEDLIPLVPLIRLRSCARNEDLPCAEEVQRTEIKKLLNPEDRPAPLIALYAECAAINHLGICQVQGPAAASLPPRYIKGVPLNPGLTSVVVSYLREGGRKEETGKFVLSTVGIVLVTLPCRI